MFCYNFSIIFYNFLLVSVTFIPADSVFVNSANLLLVQEQIYELLNEGLPYITIFAYFPISLPSTPSLLRATIYAPVIACTCSVRKSFERFRCDTRNGRLSRPVRAVLNLSACRNLRSTPRAVPRLAIAVLQKRNRYPLRAFHARRYSLLYRNNAVHVSRHDSRIIRELTRAQHVPIFRADSRYAYLRPLFVR